MGIPLDKIVTFDNNVYELTTVAIMEAQKLASRLPYQEDRPEEKLVSQALINTMADEVEYIRED